MSKYVTETYDREFEAVDSNAAATVKPANGQAALAEIGKVVGGGFIRPDD